MTTLSLLDIKQAIWDERFRALFPEYSEDINKFLQNPSCRCNNPLYKNILNHKDRLQQYFPTKTMFDVIEIKNKEDLNWKVINCHINDLQKELKKLNKLPKQMTAARYEDQITVIVNEL